MHSGWYQIAFTSELVDEITPVSIEDRCFMIVRREDGVRLFDAACPHRGAHLGHGGELDGGVVVCPFHGRRVALGEEDPAKRWAVRGYETVVIGANVFARLSADNDRGFGGVLDTLRESHFIMPAFRLDADVPATLVIENAFDTDHFVAVHGVGASPALAPLASEWGELGVRGRFVTSMANRWQDARAEGRGKIETEFRARAFSPTLVMSELRHAAGHDIVITSATPGKNGNCAIRVSIGVALEEGEIPMGRMRALTDDSRTAFEQDMPVWENMVPDVPIRFGKGDDTVAAFHRFCAGFGIQAYGGMPDDDLERNQSTS